MVQWQDFDLEGNVKIPVGFYLVLIYLMRGYITWIISLTYAEDRSLLLSLIYSNANQFSMALLIGLPAVFLFILFGLKKHRENLWYHNLWRPQKWIILSALFIDVAVQIYHFSSHLTQSHWLQMVILILGVYLLWYWSVSKRIARFIHNWMTVK